jgi:hypothetical protein
MQIADSWWSPDVGVHVGKQEMPVMAIHDSFSTDLDGSPYGSGKTHIFPRAGAKM